MASRTVLGGKKIKQNMYHSVVLSESNLQECKARSNMQNRWSDPSQTGTDGAASLTTQRVTNI